MEYLYHVSPRESWDSILHRGILPPKEVRKLIESGELVREVLGVSYKVDMSHFPEYVSMVNDHKMTKYVAEVMCRGKTEFWNNPDFMALGWRISPKIRSDPNFIDAKTVKEMHPDSYPGEVLYKGKIPQEYVYERPFAVRTW